MLVGLAVQLKVRLEIRLVGTKFADKVSLQDREDLVLAGLCPVGRQVMTNRVQAVRGVIIAHATVVQMSWVRVRRFRGRLHAIERQPNVARNIAHSSHIRHPSNQLRGQLGRQLAAGHHLNQNRLTERHVGQGRLGMLRLVLSTQMEQLFELLLVLLLRLLMVVLLRLLMMCLQRRERLHMFHVLLQNQHVVRVFFARHVNPQIASDVRLVITNVAAKRRFGFALTGRLRDQVRTVVLLVVGTSRGQWRLLRRRGVRGCGGAAAALLQFLHVIEVFITLHVYAEVALGGGGVVADLAPVRLVAAGVGLAPGESRVRLPGDAVYTRGLALRVFLLHVYLQRLLILVVPIAFGTFERFA